MLRYSPDTSKEDDDDEPTYAPVFASYVASDCQYVAGFLSKAHQAAKSGLLLATEDANARYCVDVAFNAGIIFSNDIDGMVL